MLRKFPVAVTVSLMICWPSHSKAEELQFSTVMGHNQVPLNVVQAGDTTKPGILFIHGFGQSQLAFKRQFESNLSDQFHLVAFDLRGHGASAKPWRAEDYADSNIWADDVRAVINATNLKRPVIVGWSYGGHVAMDYVKHYGAENVAGINFVGTLAGLIAPDFSTPDAESKALVGKMMKNSKLSRSQDSRENINANLSSAEDLSTNNMTESERTTGFAMQMMMPAYVRSLMGSRNYDNKELTAKVTTPVLLSRGENDFFMKEAGTKDLIKHLHDARESLYKGSGHLPFTEHAVRFNEELSKFVKASNKTKR